MGEPRVLVPPGTLVRGSRLGLDPAEARHVVTVLRRRPGDVLEALDGAGRTAVQELSVTVTPVNDNDPVITSSATPSVAENTTAVVNITATDADLVERFDLERSRYEGPTGIVGVLHDALSRNGLPTASAGKTCSVPVTDAFERL